MKIKPRIAIIGAGIAGLACATTLQNFGYEVTAKAFQAALARA